MSNPLIVVSSITYAYKSKTILERMGYKAYIERPPQEKNSCGCRYAIRIGKNDDYNTAYRLLMRSGVKIINDDGGYSL
jgi:hypothetical protein